MDNRRTSDSASFVVVEAPDVANRDGLRGQDQRWELFGKKEFVNVARQRFPQGLIQSLVGQQKMQFGFWTLCEQIWCLRILWCFKFWHMFPSENLIYAAKDRY